MIGVYRIRLLADDRCYVGSSKNIADRWKVHRHRLRHSQHHAPHLQNAWNKYGEKAFVFEVLEECSLDDQMTREQCWIDDLSPVFNATPFAGSPRGHKHTAESRAKISAAGVGRKISADGIARISVAQTGRKWSAEQRLQIAASLREHIGDACAKGHSFDELNTYWRRGNAGNLVRQCRECGRQAWRRWNASRNVAS